VTWTVADQYARRDRTYNVVEVVVKSAAGPILSRTEHSTIATGWSRMRVGASTRPAADDVGRPVQGADQVFAGMAKRLAAARIIAFSGGAPRLSAPEV
jgi:hypothetical protein